MEQIALKFKSTKNICNNNGSTLILLVIAISVIIILGTSLMNVSMMHYKIKKSNTEMKKSFYMSEKGLNTSFSIAYNLAVESVEDSIEKSNEYLLIYPSNSNEAANIFSNNFKVYILGRIESSINKNDNPKIEIINSDSLVFIDGELSISIKSKYISNDGVEATTLTDLIITVPDYDSIDTIDFSSLIYFNNWKKGI